MVTDILSNIVYIGHLAQRKSSQSLCAGLPFHRTDEEDWIIVKNTHEPLISAELFEKVQQINRAAAEQTKANAGKYDHLPKARNIYARKFTCACCGATMKLQRSMNRTRDKAYFTFKCPTFAEHGAKGCADIKMRKADLDEAVFRYIRAQMDVFIDIEKSLHTLLAEKRAALQRSDTRQEIAALRKKLERKRSLLSGLYVDRKEGLLSQEDYASHRAVLSEDIEAIKAHLAELEAAKSETEAIFTGEMKWKLLIRRFYGATEMSAELADAFIESMKLHEDDRLEIKLSYMDEFSALMDTCERLRGESA
jgi:hypothetical protein